MTLDELDELTTRTLVRLLETTACNKCGGTDAQTLDNTHFAKTYLIEVFKRSRSTDITVERVHALAMKATERRQRRFMAGELGELLSGMPEGETDATKEVAQEPTSEEGMGSGAQEDIAGDGTEEPAEGPVVPEEPAPPPRAAELFRDASEPELEGVGKPFAGGAVGGSVGKESVPIPTCSKCRRTLLPGQPCCAQR